MSAATTQLQRSYRINLCSNEQKLIGSINL